MTVKNVGVNLELVIQRQATLIGQLQSQAIMQSVALDEAHAEIARLDALVPKDNEVKEPAKRSRSARPAATQGE